MLQLLTIVILIVLVILQFVFYPGIAWIILAALDIFIGVQFFLAKSKNRFKHISALSSEANALLKRYGHYFSMPLASKDFSASAAACQIGGVVLALIGIFKAFWWGLLFAACNYFIMYSVAVALSPISLLAKNPILQIAHDEIVDFIYSAPRLKDSLKN